MIYYVCKYTPTHVLECFGEETKRIDPSIYNFDKSDALMHPNICSYGKSILEYCLNNNIEELVLINCCDSIRRLYDVLSLKGRLKFLHLVDLPRKNTCCSINLFKNEILKLIEHYESYKHIRFDINRFSQIARSLDNIHPSYAYENNKVNLVLLGARCKPSLISLIENCDVKVAYNYTCTGDNLYYDKLQENEDPLLWYAKSTIEYFPCLRMADLEKRKELLYENKDKFHGIIYHTIKFCDFYSYEYAKLKNNINIPMLKIETDYTEQSEGQMKTRIEAFIESLKPKLSTGLQEKNSTPVEKSSDKLIFMGIDSGSTSTNAVIIDKDKNILSYSVVRTGSKSSIGVENAFNTALKNANLIPSDISFIVSTGYGRTNISFANESVTEITCHAKGANFVNPDINTIIDIGGQDSKVIRLDSAGDVIDFSMNDKCAAGTGRFLEMMAKTLEISIDHMGPLSLGWKENIAITSMCSVFAESEVISLIADNKEKSDIIHGLCNSIASRTISLLDRVKKQGKYMMTGGVAKNIGVVNAIEKRLGETIIIPDEPEIIGALGAAIIALEKGVK